MNVRIKFAKYGTLKFISHLDVMRFFQKAIRRAELDVCYSEGFNPHQIMSFASPLGVGQTSEGEYFDAEFHSVPSMDELCERLNAVMTEGMKILSAERLPDHQLNTKKETAMALVAAADYLVLRKDGYDEELSADFLRSEFTKFLAQKEILAWKKTKNSETEINVAPFIFKGNAEGTVTEYSGSYENGVCFYLLLSSGSVNNIKPELIMEAFYTFMGKEYNPYAYQFHRLETYADLSLNKISQAEIAQRTTEGTMPEQNLVPLMKYHGKEL